MNVSNASYYNDKNNNRGSISGKWSTSKQKFKEKEQISQSDGKMCSFI
jgi:hypothetical protein